MKIADIKILEDGYLVTATWAKWSWSFWKGSIATKRSITLFTKYGHTFYDKNGNRVDVEIECDLDEKFQKIIDTSTRKPWNEESNPSPEMLARKRHREVGERARAALNGN